MHKTVQSMLKKFQKLVAAPLGITRIAVPQASQKFTYCILNMQYNIQDLMVNLSCSRI